MSDNGAGLWQCGWQGRIRHGQRRRLDSPQARLWSGHDLQLFVCRTAVLGSSRSCFQFHRLCLFPLHPRQGRADLKLAQDKQTTFVENLIAAGKLDSPEFSFHLTRGGASGSTLTLGGVNAAHYTGTISYTPVISQTYWEVQAEQPVVNGQAVGSPFGAAIDTGVRALPLAIPRRTL